VSFLSEVQLGNEFGPFAAFQAALGFIPNLLHAQTLLPRIVEAQAKLEFAVRLQDGATPRIQKERILLTVAADRNDTYCVAADSKVLASLGASEAQVDDLLNERHCVDLSAADLTSLQFCLKLSRATASVSWEDIEVLRANGLRDDAIFEAVAVTALAVYRCTLSAGLGPEPDFELRKVTSRRNDQPSVPAVHGSSVEAHQAAQRKKGPYLPAPYLSPKTFAPFAIAQRSHGFIPNFFRAQTLRPDLLEAVLEAMERILVPESTLTRVQKECILLAVSARNLNSYCVAIHCNLLRGLGMSAEEGDQIAVDHHESNLPERDRALLDFAVKLGTRFSEFSREDIAKLQTFGFSEEQILESVAVTALNNFANTLQMGLGIEPDFAPPPSFEMNLSGSGEALMRGAGVVPLVNTLPDADAGLVAAAQSGKLEAFEELVRRHTRLSYRSLIAILGNPADAQDAMQDTLLSAFEHIGDFQGRSKFSTWLVSIAKNAALKRLRHGKRFESLDEVEHNEDGLSASSGQGLAGQSRAALF
jgi:uncharacterized peroxidase-related enzyme